MESVGCQAPRSLNFIPNYHAKKWRNLDSALGSTTLPRLLTIFHFTKHLLHTDMCRTLCWALRVHEPVRLSCPHSLVGARHPCRHYFNAAKVVRVREVVDRRYDILLWFQGKMGVVGRESWEGHTQFSKRPGQAFLEQIQTHGGMKQQVPPHVSSTQFKDSVVKTSGFPSFAYQG